MTPPSLFDRIRSLFSVSNPSGQQGSPQTHLGTAAEPVSAREFTRDPGAPKERKGVDEALPATEPRNLYEMSDAQFEEYLAAEKAKDAQYEPTTDSLPRSKLLTKTAEADTIQVDGAGMPNLHLIRISGHYALAVPDGRIVSPKSTSIYRHDLFLITVRGRSDYEEANLATSTTAGTLLGLRRDPDNEHDPNAVAVMDSSTSHQIGWVNKGHAKRLAKRMDGGETLTVLSLRGSPSGKNGDPVVVLVTRPELLVHLQQAGPPTTVNAPREERVQTDPDVLAEDRWRAGTPPVHGLAKQSVKASEVSNVRTGQRLRVERVNKHWVVLDPDGVILGDLRWRYADSGRTDPRSGLPIRYPDKGVLHVTRLHKADGQVIDFGGYVTPDELDS